MTTYTHGHDESVLRSHRWRTADNSAGYLLRHLTAGASLLDVGCGPGTITLDLAARVASGHVVGVDAVAEPLPSSPTVAFAVASVFDLPFPSDSFDVTHAHQVLQHLSDPVAALREMARVTAPGGLVAARDADYATMTWWPEVPALDLWLSVYRATARGNGAEPDAGRRLLGWAQAAGLSADATASTWCFATQEDRAWWGGTWSRRALDSSFATQAVAQGHCGPDDLLAMSDAFLEWAAAPDAWWAMVHGEVLARV